MFSRNFIYSHLKHFNSPIQQCLQIVVNMHIDVKEIFKKKHICIISVKNIHKNELKSY